MIWPNDMEQMQPAAIAPLASKDEPAQSEKRNAGAIPAPAMRVQRNKLSFTSALGSLINPQAAVLPRTSSGALNC
jgi:hypothetical protein